MRRLLMLSAMALLAGCETVASRPCPRVTEFPRDLQMQAADELATAPALRRMMDAMAGDRAFNRAVCAR
jgi:hypothetical protein